MIAGKTYLLGGRLNIPTLWDAVQKGRGHDAASFSAVPPGNSAVAAPFSTGAGRHFTHAGRYSTGAGENFIVPPPNFTVVGGNLVVAAPYFAGAGRNPHGAGGDFQVPGGDSIEEKPKNVAGKTENLQREGIISGRPESAGDAREEKSVRATDAKEVGVENPAEETFRDPDRKYLAYIPGSAKT